MTARIGILKPGSTFTGMIERFGDYDAWFVRALAPVGVACEVHDVVAQAPPDPDTADGWIITGARTSVIDGAPWVGRLTAWIREAIERETPLLGVCYGHQAMCAAMGGRVEPSSAGWELGTVEVELTPEGREDPLFAGFPDHFPVQTTHEDHVSAAPPGTTVLARNAHSEIQALAIGPTARGVQFHPEVTTPIARDFVARRGHLADPAPVVAEAPHAANVLTNFVAAFVRPGRP